MKRRFGLAVMTLMVVSSAWGQELVPAAVPPRDCPAPVFPLPAGERMPPADDTTPLPTPSDAGAAPTPAPSTADQPFAGTPADVGGDTLSLFDSSAGYIDSALIGNVFRIRADAAYNNRRPSRAEFFYAKGGPPATGNPGLPLPERKVDYQEFLTYLEVPCSPRFSVFAEGGARLLDPAINRNHGGGTDMITGFKYAFLQEGNRVATAQLKTYIPTGDARLGLGTDHVSLEPGVLVHHRWSPRLALDGELRYWIPIGGTDFAGDIIRYGIGLSFGQPCPQQWWLTPVVEVVGWSVLGGKALAVAPSGIGTVEDADGDTIVNVKLGARIGWSDLADVYLGYGRALTGDAWYKDIARLELRLNY